MIARSAVRASALSPILARRGFHTTRARLSSPYHYPEGPLTNIPFNPRTKWFGVRYWGTMGESDSSCPAFLLMECKGFFFSIPFIIAGTFMMMILRKSQWLKLSQSGKRRRTARSHWAGASFTNSKPFHGVMEMAQKGIMVQCIPQNKIVNNKQTFLMNLSWALVSLASR